VQNTVFDELRKAFPNTRILPGIGNNDMDPKNTNMQATFTRLFSLFMQKANITEDQRETFLYGGYWHWHDTKTGLRVLLPNSNLFYSKSKPIDLYWQNVSDQQLLWIEKELEHARNQSSKVIIGSHVPPTRTEGEDDWHNTTIAKYRALIEKYSDTILLQLFGHHSTEMIRGYSPNFGVLISSGFAPRTATIPTYQLVKHNYSAPGQRTAVVKEVTSYYFDLIAAASNPQGAHPWMPLYEITKTYGVPDVSPQSLYYIANKIVTDQATANKYFALQMRPPLDVLNTSPERRIRMLCESAVATPVDANQCAETLAAKGRGVIVPIVGDDSSDPALGYIIGAVLLTVALLTIAGGAFFLLIRKRAELDLRAREMLIGDQREDS